VLGPGVGKPRPAASTPIPTGPAYLAPAASEVKSQKSEVKSQKAEVRTQKRLPAPKTVAVRKGPVAWRQVPRTWWAAGIASGLLTGLLLAAFTGKGNTTVERQPGSDREESAPVAAAPGGPANGPSAPGGHLGLIQRGQALARQREWKKATDLYAEALQLQPTVQGHFWFERAALLLLGGDAQGYRDVCEQMINQSGWAQQQQQRPYHVARACTLAPESVKELGKVADLAQPELSRWQREFWSLTQQGALAYRTGQFEQAAGFFQESLKVDSWAGRAVLNWLWLALAEQQQGHPQKAQEWLERATAFLDAYRDGITRDDEVKSGMHLHNWLEAHILRREFEALRKKAGAR
jgi:tetratricopeptide (TPR) repeat protein